MPPRPLLLSGPHVALATMTVEDQPYFQQWLSGNPELRALIDDHRVPTIEDQHKWFARVQEPDRKMFSLVTVPQQELIGNAGFVHIDPKQRTATFRITIGIPEFHSKGYGSEATKLLIAYGFDQMKLKRITLNVLKTNARAIRTYEKAGFAPIDDPQAQSGTLTMAIDSADQA